jgi:hypothetical protein
MNESWNLHPKNNTEMSQFAWIGLFYAVDIPPIRKIGFSLKISYQT